MDLERTGLEDEQMPGLVQGPFNILRAFKVVLQF